jgi:hypothetical protein
MADALQIFGALMILAAYTGGLTRVMEPRSYTYLLLNLAGSTLLGVLAYREEQWGFLLLESAWALISLWGLLQRVRGVGAAQQA